MSQFNACVQKPLLPSGYIQTEYTQSYSVATQNGASIFTDIKPSLDLVSELDFEFTEFFSNASCFVFGSDPSDKKRYAAYVNAARKWLLGWDGAVTSETATATTGVRYNIRVDSGKLYVDNVVVAESSLTGVNTNCGIILFAYNYTANGNMPARFSRMKLYSAKFTRGGTLIAHFIPCKRVSDSAPGMYDIVRDRFFPCESIRGTGNYFIAGEEVAAPFIEFKNVSLNQYYRPPMLPLEYVDCEYIKSTRAQRIDTGYIPKANVGMDITLKFGGSFITGTSGGNTIFGVTETDGRVYSANFGASANQGNQIFHWLSHSYDGTHTWSMTINNSVRTTKNTWSLTTNSVTYGTFSIVPQQKTEDMTNSLVIFGSKTKTGELRIFTFYELYVYQWVIKEGGTVVMNLVPKQRISDGVYGLYDTISGTFFGSDTNTPFEGG